MIKPSLLSIKILYWYDSRKRDLPWRSPASTPYQVWLSEIMLQQTTVPTVIPYFNKFIIKWPTVNDLAKANLDEILVQWQGLGYYSRARNLHKCARIVVENHEGLFPRSFSALLTLPGIGQYTAAAIASIAYDQPEVVIDGNIVRIISRLYAIETPYPASKPLIEKYAKILTPSTRSGDYAQALMDLGSMVCKPKNPQCSSCPLSFACQAYRKGKPSHFPVKKAKRDKPVRYTVAFLIENSLGQILIRKREEKGLLGGMMEVPSSPWSDKPDQDIFSSFPLAIPTVSPLQLAGEIQHAFTHFHLKVKVVKTQIEQFAEGTWAHPRCLHLYALPTLIKKIIKKGYLDVSI